MLEPLPSSFRATREALHALAEHVIAPARYHADGRIGLTPTPGGFGTPVFDDGGRVRVDGVELVHERPGSTRRVPITTLAAAATFIEVPLGAPTEVYKPTTACLPDTALDIDADAARALAEWYQYAAALLHDLAETYAIHQPSGATLWPEHFDVAMELGDAAAGTRANYGASAGDATVADPYLYIGPWDTERRTGALGTHAFGTAITYDALRAVDDPVGAGRDFFFDGAALLVGTA
jgi:hypothetical protein